jgi:hypothetical protein
MLTVCNVNIVESDDEAALAEAAGVLDSSLSPSTLRAVDRRCVCGGEVVAAVVAVEEGGRAGPGLAGHAARMTCTLSASAT